jgi:3-hydroxy-9,10-secoandrosta-1,3,5(10)-triene-9,17-dione monooxygenase reductase component
LPVTIWLAGVGDRDEDLEGSDERIAAVGLTVSSVVVSLGAPPMLAGLISPASDLAEVLEISSAARFVVHLLNSGHRRLAQHFAGALPAPEELLVTRPSAHGPVLEAVTDRILCRMTASKPFGWSTLVEAEVEGTEVGEPGKGLAWYHGAFQVLDS